MAEQEEQQDNSIKGDLSNLQPAFADYTTERSNQSVKHWEGITSFDCTAMPPSVDWALQHSAKAVPLSASSPPGTQHCLPTQQPAAQTQLTAPSLPATPSMVASPAAHQLSKQAH